MNTCEEYGVGADGDDKEGYASNRSTHSVKVSLRHKVSTGDDGLSVNAAGEDRSINSVKKSLRDSMGTWVRTGMGAVSCGTDGCTVGKKSNCSMDSVKDWLRDEMNTTYRNDKSEVDYDVIKSSTADVSKCSTDSVNGCLRYDMTQLGCFVSLLEFNLKERYYRYSKSFYGGRRAKVIDNIGVMVFIPF